MAKDVRGQPFCSPKWSRPITISCLLPDKLLVYMVPEQLKRIAP
jgi:hypothetical protein